MGRGSGSAAIRWPILAALPLLVAAAPVELVVHVAAGEDGAAVSDDAWIDDAIATANTLFGGADLSLSRAHGDPAGVPVEVASVADRDALALLAADGALHVFVVSRLADKDSQGAWIKGVTWRYAGGKRTARYLIVARDSAAGDTLAHELGHFFGLHHTTLRDNLMTSPGRDQGAALDEAQLAIVRRRAASWCWRPAVRNGEVDGK